MINALKYAKNLEEAGIPRKQAEAQVQMMIEMNLATKQDILMLEQKLIQSEQRITIKLGTIVSLAIGIAVTLAKLAG